MAEFALLESPKLISRQIRVIEKWWNFHTVRRWLKNGGRRLPTNWMKNGKKVGF